MFVICGEALYDLFPEESPDGGLRLDARIGGSPFNVAVGMARMGRASALLTGLSTDMLGERLARTLSAEGVCTDLLVRKAAPTTLSLVGVGPDGAPQYAFYGERCADRLLEPAELPALPDAATGLHLGSYSIVVPPVADALLTLAEREKDRRFISLDPNVRFNVEPDAAAWRRSVDTLAPMADLVKISLEDIETLYPDTEPEALAADWLARGAGLVVVTRGGDGALALTRAGRVEVGAQRIDVVDTVGAGDTFQAALLTALGELGLDRPGAPGALDASALKRVLAFASRAAAITCSRRGADLPRRAAIGDL